MEIVGKVAATIQNVLGPEAEELGRATGVIQRRRKFTAVSLLRMLVLTLLRKPDAKATDFQSTAAQLGLDVTSTAVENRFTPQLVGFLRAVLERTVLRVLAASPQTVDLLNKFTSVRIGDSSTIALPDELADQFPGCGGILRAGLAAMKIHLLWDFLTGSILQLRITPGRASDATNPIAQEVAPAGSLSLFDLGYFCLDRFQNLTRAGAFWISRLQHGTSVFEGVIAPVPRIMRPFWAFSPSNPPESPSQEVSSPANMLDTLESKSRSIGSHASPRSIGLLPDSRSFLTVSAVA